MLIHRAGQDIWKETKKVVNTLHDDIKGVTNFAGKEIGQVVKSGSLALEAAPKVIENSIGSISTAIPYAFVGLAALGGVYYFTQKGSNKRQFFRANESNKRFSFGLGKSDPMLM